MIPFHYVDSRDPSHHPVEPEPEVREYPVFAVDFWGHDDEASCNFESRHVHLKRFATVDRWGETEHEFEATIKALQFIEAADPVTDLIETAASEGINIHERELNILWT
jgi:hypothetical protein